MSMKLYSGKLPKKINPCPISEAIVELRFDSQFPADAVFGVLYNEFKNDYPNVQELPILQLPELVRKQDPLLKFKPYYRLSSDDQFMFQVGARVISLTNRDPYSGWDTFSKRIKDLIKRVNKLNITNAYIRVGIRYINVFNDDILKKISLSLKIGDECMAKLDTYIRLEIPTESFANTLQITNNVQINRAGSVVKGSLVDIDTYVESPQGDVMSMIDKGHLEEKRLFFTLLKEEFVKEELNAEY